MNVIINDKTYSITESSPTVLTALAAADIEPKGIAVALNSTVVPRDQLATQPISDGDLLIIIKAFYGG